MRLNPTGAFIIFTFQKIFKTHKSTFINISFTGVLYHLHRRTKIFDRGSNPYMYLVWLEKQHPQCIIDWHTIKLTKFHRNYKNLDNGHLHMVITAVQAKIICTKYPYLESETCWAICLQVVMHKEIYSFYGFSHV